MHERSKRPTGFSIFSVGPKSPEAMITTRLLTKGTLCEEMDEEQLAFLTSGKMVVPSCAHDLIRQLRIWMVTLSFFFKRGSTPTCPRWKTS